MNQSQSIETNNRVCIFDIEWFTDTGIPWLIGCLDIFTHKYWDNQSPLTAWEEFYKFITQIDKPKEERSNLTLYAHFGGKADSKVLISMLTKMGYEPFNCRTQDKYYYSYLISNGIVYELNIFTEGQKVRVLDSYRLLPVSAKMLGAESKKEEHVITFRKSGDIWPITDKERFYTKHDCLAIAPYLEHELFYGSNDRIQLTIGSFTRQKFRSTSNFAKWNLINQLSTAQWDEIAKSFRGGITQVNPNFQGKYIEGTYYKYDFRSRYPSIMLEPLPYGKPLKEKPKEGTYATLHFIEIYHAKLIGGNWPILGYFDPIKKAIQYDAEIENIEYALWDFELAHFEKVYRMRYKIIKTYYFKTCPYYRKFVQDLYNKRIEAKKEGNSTLEKIIKFMLNNLYGKEAQKRINDNVGIIERITPETKIEKDTITYYGEYYYHVIEQEETNTFKLGYIPMASYITARARIELDKVRSRYRKHWVYSDTDSFIFYNFQLPPHEVSEEDILGTLKFEGSTNKGFWHGPKKYWWEDTWFFNGLMKENSKGEALNMTFEEFKNISEVQDGKANKKYIDGRPIIIDSKFTFKTINKINI